MNSKSILCLNNLLIVVVLLTKLTKTFSLYFVYPTATTLIDGNIFIIHKTGITICDSSFTEKIRDEVTFIDNEKIESEEELSKITISKYDDGYIICLIINKLYFFNQNGEFEFSQLIDENKNLFITLALDRINTYTYTYTYTNYYYLIGYIKQNLLYLFYYKYNSSNKNIQPIYSLNGLKDRFERDFNEYYIQNNGLTCQIMNYKFKTDFICIYSNYINYKNYISIITLQDQINFDSPTKIKNDFRAEHYESDNITFIKSEIGYNKSYILVWLYNSTYKSSYFIYSLYEKNIKLYSYKECNDKYYGLKLSYFLDSKQFTSSCFNKDGNIVINFFNSNLNNITTVTYKNNKCKNIFGYSLLYLTNNYSYHIISDLICNITKIPFYYLISLDEIKRKEINQEEEKDKAKEIAEETVEEITEEIIKEINEEKIEEEKMEEDEKEEEIEEEEKKIVEKEEIEEGKIEEEKIEEEKIEEEKIEEEKIEKEKIEEEIAEKEEERIEEENKENINEDKTEIEKENEEKIEKKEEEKEKNNCIEMEKCQLCNKESISKNLCIKCNNQKGYYYLNANSIGYIDCVNNKTKPSNFYFNKENKDFRPCYELCATCDYDGDGNENNCTSCESNYILKPDYADSTNCVRKCQYFYYYTNFGQYKCTNTPICPDEYNLLIKEKGKCIDNCENDNEYKYQYNGECFKECPINTNHDNNKYICKDINLNKCLLSENKLAYIGENISEIKLEELAEKYAKEFYYTNDHVSIFLSNIYTITLYKNNDCISELSLKIPEIDFGECYSKVKLYYQINNNLIIAIITKNIDDMDYPKLISYSMFDPLLGEKLSFNDICKDSTLIFQENLMDKLNNSKNDIKSLKHLTEQNIDIFNLSCGFYTDICYVYDSPIEGKDLSLKDRISTYYPNISLCENNCQIKGVNLTSYKAICECLFNNIINNKLLENNILSQSQLGQIEKILSKTNILIIKCYKNFLNFKFFISSPGTFIIVVMIIIEIILTIMYYINSSYKIRKYLFSITDKYISYLLSQKNNLNSNNNLSSKDKTIIINNGPPKKRLTIKHNTNKLQIMNRKSIKSKFSKKFSVPNININNLLKDNSKKRKFSIFRLSKKNFRNSKAQNPKLNLSNSSKQSLNENFINSKDQLTKIRDPNCSISQNKLMLNLKIDININMEEYLSTDPDHMDYDDAIKKDKRTFNKIFLEKIKNNQLINIIYVNEPLKPKPIKILLFILNVDLYLFINGLFFNEDYISQMFNLAQEDNFFTFIQRFSERFFYITIAGIILIYIIDFFFVEEKKIKGIFKREKENIMVLKYEINRIIKTIISRYLSFIILTFLITFFTLYYAICFNSIYPSMKGEWIKASIINIISMQILSIIECFLETIIRFFSFKLKSEKLYKISIYYRR